MKKSTHSLEDYIDAATRIHRSALRLVRVLRALSDRNFSFAKMGILIHLYRNGVSTATGLANYLKIKPQSVTRVLAELEKNGYIQRRPDDIDRRQSLIEITPEGRELLLSEGRDQQERLAMIMKETLTDTENQIMLLAGRLMDDLSEGLEGQFENESFHKSK